jgi:uncharacterized protein (TIGR03437 family)
MKFEMTLKSKLLTLGSCLLAGAVLGQAQTTPVTCTAATLTGTHSLILTGRNVSSTAVLSNVFLATGTANFDGVSAVTLSLTINTNQTPGVVQTWSGTYGLPANCLGTLTIATGDTASFTLIPYNKGNNFTITGQDATYGYTGTGSVGPNTCITASLSGSYAFTGNGFILGAGAITGVNTISGLLNFDGAGSLLGSWSVTTSGTSTTASVHGAYTVSSSCTATATLTDSNGVPFTLSFTLTSADGANFGVNVATATGTFTGNGHSTFSYPGLAVEQAAGVSLATPPGSIFSIYGYGLSAGAASFSTFPVPLTLSSASVTVNGESVPLYYANNKALGAEGLINAIMPYDVQPGVATLVVKNGTTASNAVAINIPSTAVPAIFTYVTATGTNHASAQNVPSYTLNSSTSPANIGDTVVVYFTGGGTVQGQSTLVKGQATPSAAFPITTAATATATVAGIAATIDYIGLVPTAIGGFYQVNVVIPKVAAGDRNLVINIGGKASNAAFISVN